MAVTIIPGYDFGVNEVPNRETLLRQARRLKVTGIGLDNIDATLVGFKSGTTSGTTGSSLPAPGWMWADPQGSMWVETDHGPVKLKRDGGGFESRRWGQTYSPETPVPPSGSPFKAAPADAGGTQTDGINLTNGESGAASMWDENFRDSSDGALTENLMFCAETMATTDSFPRLVGRGLTLFKARPNGVPQDMAIRRPGVARVFSTDNGWLGAFTSSESNVVSGQNKECWFGTFVGPHSGTSLVNSGSRIDMKGDCFGWKYDQAVFGPGAGL